MENNQGTKERLLTFIAYLRIRKSEFERRCGLSNGYINSIKGDIGVQKLVGMTQAFPQLNPTWVATGEGEMLRPVEGMPLEDGVKGINGVSSFEGKTNRELTYEEKYEKVIALLTDIQQREEMNRERILKLREALKMKEDQINRLLYLVDKLNYNKSESE